MSDDTGAWTAYVIPVALLAVLAGVILIADPGGWIHRDGPPPEPELTVDRTTMEPGLIRLEVTNEGVGSVTIAQVLVDEAYWDHSIEPDHTIDRLGSATVEIPYPWVQDEPVEIVMVMADGATVAHEIDAATTTAGANADTLAVYVVIGLFVGVLPVAAGVAWYPAIRKGSQRFQTGLLAFTVGLLAFLVVESLAEGLELAEAAPGPLGGPGLVLLGVVAALAALWYVSDALDADRSRGTGGLRTAYMIATGIGLHNLGEGLAIGAAYAIGEVALGTFLIIGFTLHNVTEGPAIVAPLGDDASLGDLAGLAAVGGLPTVAGALIGGLAFTPLLGALFFAIGAGAMLQVIVDVGGQLAGRAGGRMLTRPVAVGALLGVVAMWSTGLLI